MIPPHDSANSLRVLGVMAKFWEPGLVKTRLALSLAKRPNQPAVNSQQSADSQQAKLMTLAANVHQRFLCQLLRTLSEAGDARELVGSPPARLAEFQRALAESKLAGWQITDQGDGNLGERMNRWFSGQILDKARVREHAVEVAAVLIGADCPLISTADLDLAWSSLTHHDMVLGPAHDGGYYLIGLSSRLSRADLSKLFEGIQWGTETVLQQTLAAARMTGLNVALLDPQHDVDTADDLWRLMRSLMGGDAHSLALLAQLHDLGLPGFEMQ